MPKKTDNPVAQLLTTRSLDTSRVDGGTEDGLVPVTYYPVLMQQQFIRNRAEVKDKPYSGFWNPDLVVAASNAKLLQQGVMPSEQTLTPGIADINKLLDGSIDFPDAGYAVLDGPTAYLQSRIEMAGVTTDMFKWWFT